VVGSVIVADSFVYRTINKRCHRLTAQVKLKLIERQTKLEAHPMATRGRPRTFDPDTALRQALNLFWERGYEGTSINDLAQAMGIASPSIYACFGSKEELFRQVMALYGATSGEPPRRALREHPTAREAVHAMLRATADQITGPDTPHYCMLVLAAATGTVENHTVREFLADRRRDMLATIKHRLARGVTDGDLIAPPATLDAVARYYTTVVQGLSVQARDGATRAELETVVSCAMAAWDTLAPSAQGHAGETS
jgi:AcrR family transcriptional regulator